MISLLFFKHGWRWAFGPFFIGWNHQETYTEFRIGFLTSSDFKQAGGMTWAEWALANKQAKASAKEKAAKEAIARAEQAQAPTHE